MSIRLKITQADAKKAGPYTSPTTCLLAQAAKRHFKTVEVLATYGVLEVRGQVFVVSINGANRICSCYRDDVSRRRFKPFNGDKVPTMRHFKPFSVTLEKRP